MIVFFSQSGLAIFLSSLFLVQLLATFFGGLLLRAVTERQKTRRLLKQESSWLNDPDETLDFPLIPETTRVPAFNDSWRQFQTPGAVRRK